MFDDFVVEARKKLIAYPEKKLERSKKFPLVIYITTFDISSHIFAFREFFCEVQKSPAVTPFVESMDRQKDRLSSTALTLVQTRPFILTVEFALAAKLVLQFFEWIHQDMIMERVVGFLGLLVMFAICWVLSTDRRKIVWRTVVNGTFLQLIFAFAILKTSWGKAAFNYVDVFANNVLAQAKSGAVFLFSSALGDPEVATKFFGEGNGFIFAFQALPVVIFVSALTAILYHLGIMQLFVRGMAKVMQDTMRISGAESCCAAANVILGQTEAPLTIRPFLARMTKSELHCMMVGGMATVSGSVLAGYVAMLNGHIDGVAAHFVAASVMSAPAAIVFAKMLIPETEEPETMRDCRLPSTKMDSDLVSACTRGCSEGMQLAINIAAMLIGFLSVIALLQWSWGALVTACGGSERFSLQAVIGYAFSPFAYLLGIPARDAVVAGQLLGEKTMLNEFVAYSHFADLLGTSMADCSARTRIIISYALCGFANIGSIGVLVGGIGALIPERKSVLVSLVWRALLGGTFASFSTAVIAGMLL